MATVATVEALIQAGGPHVAGLMEELETRLAVLAGSHGPELARHGGTTIAAGGKRLRPLLVFLSAGEAPDARPGSLRAAAAVELVHSATLVHDDVLDRGTLRRGRPTVVAAAGRQMATAAGDFLFSRAFVELAEGGRPDAVAVLADACLGLSEGELMQRADAWDPTVSVERYERRCELKTARLFEAACRLGALEGAGPERELGEFGRRIVLDVSGPAERTGKPRGADLLDGTVTLPLILAREREPGLATIDLRAVGEAEVAALCDRIAATGALDAARSRALGIVAEAKAGLPDLPARQRAALELVADGVVERFA